jgi:uncharacterized protein (DUF2237 family)
MSRNMLGDKLKKCKCNSRTGWLRDNYCSYNKEDRGKHIVCASVTKDFLLFSYSRGNDLITPRGDFPGLVPGDIWCLCVERWIEAYKAGVAPPIYIKSSDIEVLKYVDINILKRYALDL